MLWNITKTIVFGSIFFIFRVEEGPHRPPLPRSNFMLNEGVQIKLTAHEKVLFVKQVLLIFSCLSFAGGGEVYF
jgi:hypothetical protein